jgi:hypothetical protein
MAYTLSSSQPAEYQMIEIESASCAQGNVRVNPLVETGAKTTTPTATLTPTTTPTVTPTVTNTPTASGLLLSVVAGPNVSQNGQPIKFMVNLGTSAAVQLSLYSLTGEGVFSETVQGNAGMNTLLWLLKNNSQAPVASGLYVYTIRVNDGYEISTKTGKVLVMH